MVSKSLLSIAATCFLLCAQGASAYSVSGRVYEDVNSNRLYDAGEGRGGIPTTILGSDAIIYTDAAGNYSLAVAVGNWTLRFQGEAIAYNGGALGNVDVPITVDTQDIRVNLRMDQFPNWVPGVTTSSTSSTTTSSTTTSSTTTTTAAGTTTTTAAGGTTTTAAGTTTTTAAATTTTTSTASTTTTTLAHSGAPVVRIAATPSTGFSPFSLKIDGSGSYDPDGGSLRYQWYILGQPLSTSPTLNYPEVKGEGLLAFTLSVTDTSGQTSSRQVNITVIDGSCEPAHEIRNEIAPGDYDITVPCDILVQDVVVGTATTHGDMNLRSGGKITLKPNFQVLPGSRFSAAIGN